MKLMIVDNEIETRELTRELIGAFADEVLECTNGSDAATQCATFCPDVVTMALDMPLTGGLEATRRVLAKHPAARVTVIRQNNWRRTHPDSNVGSACHFFAKDNLGALVRHLKSKYTERAPDFSLQ